MKEQQTDWAGLRTASGRAEGIPAALAALRSPDSNVRQAAYWKIDNHAVLQGDLYEVAPWVVRALLDYLRTTPAANEEVYELLVEFAGGQAAADQVVVLDGLEQHLLAATIGELVKGITLYWRDLQDPAAGTRNRVADLLLALSDTVELDAVQLRIAFETEGDERVREILGELLGEVGA